MPPRKRCASEPVSDEASTQPQNIALRGCGRGRDHGQGRHGRGGGMPEVEIPRATHRNPTLAQLTANMQNMQEILLQLVYVVGERSQQQAKQQQPVFYTS